jgi:hypothetical protein
MPATLRAFHRAAKPAKNKICGAENLFDRTAILYRRNESRCPEKKMPGRVGERAPGKDT